MAALVGSENNMRITTLFLFTLFRSKENKQQCEQEVPGMAGTSSGGVYDFMGAGTENTNPWKGMLQPALRKVKKVYLVWCQI